MKVGDPVEVYRFDDPYGVIVETRKRPYAQNPDWCVKFPDGHVEWIMQSIALYDASAPVPSLDEDLAAMAAGNPSWSALRRVAASHDDRALEAMLSRAGEWPSILDALNVAAHPAVLERAAVRVDAWLASGDASDRDRALAMVHGLAARRLVGWESRMRTLEAAVADKDKPAVIAARMMVPGASAAELATMIGTPAGRVVLDALMRRCPEAGTELLVPLLREGDDSLREEIAFALPTALGSKFERGRTRDAPPLSPAWFELGLVLEASGAPPTLARLTKTFLAATHPDREGAIARALAAQPAAKQARMRAKNPLLDIDAATVARLGLQDALRGEEGGWMLMSRDLSLAQLDEAWPVIASLSPSLHFFAEKEMVAWPGLANYTRISLTDQKLGKAGLVRFLKSKFVRQVEVLDLSASNIGALGVKALAASDALPKLRRLALDGGDYDTKSYADDALEALAAGTGASLRGVTELSIAGWRPRTLVPLAMSPLGKRLRVLSLDGHMTLGTGVKELLDTLAKAGGVLEELDLRHVFLNFTDGSDDWNNHESKPVTPLPTLRALSLDGCSFNATRMQALVDAWFWPQLERLSIGWPGMNLAPLERAEPGLKSLSLRFNSDVDDDALDKMAAWPLFRSLVSLDLRETKVTRAPAGMAAQIRL